MPKKQRRWEPDANPLIVCVCEQDVEGLKELISQGFDVNSPVGIGDIRALHAVAIYSSPTETAVSICKLLLEAGADPLMKDIGGRTPIDWAREGRRAWSLKIFAEHLRRKSIRKLKGSKRP